MTEERDSKNWSTSRLMSDAICTGDRSSKAQTEIKFREIEALNLVAKNIQTASNSSESLGKRVFWLNIILTIATMALALIAWLEYQS